MLKNLENSEPKLPLEVKKGNYRQKDLKALLLDLTKCHIIAHIKIALNDIDKEKGPIDQMIKKLILRLKQDYSELLNSEWKSLSDPFKHIFLEEMGKQIPQRFLAEVTRYIRSPSIKQRNLEGLKAKSLNGHGDKQSFFLSPYEEPFTLKAQYPYLPYFLQL